ERHYGFERIDRACPSVSGGEKTAQPARRQAVIGRARHLQDERLFDCYVAERSGEPLDPPSAEHLADCVECGARYGELTQFMDGLRSEAETETDEIFTAEQLRLQ